MTDTIKLVTVTIVNADGETDCYSDTCTGEQILQEVIKGCTDEARDRFTDNYYSAITRTIVHVTTLPRPKLLAQTITATLPEQTEGERPTIEATVS